MNRAFCLLSLIFLTVSVYSLENGQGFSNYLPRVVQLTTDSQWQKEFNSQFESLYKDSAVSNFSLGLLSSIIKNKSTFPKKPDQAARFMMNYLVQIDREQKSNPRFLAVKLKFDHRLTHLESSDVRDFQMTNWRVVAAEAGIVVPEERWNSSKEDKEAVAKDDSRFPVIKIDKGKDKADKVKVDKVKVDKIKEDKIKQDKVKEDKDKVDKVKEDKIKKK